MRNERIVENTANSSTGKVHLLDPEMVTDDITESDITRYRRVTSTWLSPEVAQRLTRPVFVQPHQNEVLAIHWHPEFVPMELIHQRISATFPSSTLGLIVPTQHNTLTSYDSFSGVEIDCYEPAFNLKVQLLAHFDSRRLEGADVFRNMLEHTFRYRATQLDEYVAAIISPAQSRVLDDAINHTGVTEDVVRFVRVHAVKIDRMIRQLGAETPVEMLRNKLLANYFDTLRDSYDGRLIAHAQVLLKAVKELVKSHFKLDYFYQAREFIEEIRSLGGGIIIPHPEQFWPVLLADYDVDGYEVWNPQSRAFTEFLVSVVNRQNKSRRHESRRLLVTMGDDCHMGEKAKEPIYQDAEKAGREIGVQPAWEDLLIRKTLLAGHFDRRTVIEEYRARLTN